MRLWTPKISKAAAGAFAAFAVCVFFAACNTYDDNGRYGRNRGESIQDVIRYEGNNMSTVLNDTALDSASASADTALDSTTGERVTSALHYDAVCQCFARASLFTDWTGFSTQSQDTILLDSSGIRLSRFHPGDADTIVQFRYVTQIAGDTTTKLSLLFQHQPGARHKRRYGGVRLGRRDYGQLERNSLKPEFLQSRADVHSGEVRVSHLGTRRVGFLRDARVLSGGVKESRTPDLLRAKQALYQLSYNP